MGYFDQFPEQSFQARCTCNCIRAFHHANSGRCHVNWRITIITPPEVAQKGCQCQQFEAAA